MRILQISPGAGAMYCGGCLRDNALVTALRHMGHDALMVPLYLPLTLDEQDQSANTPIFFGGINVYLEQQSAWYRRAPAWLHRLFGSRAILGWIGRRMAGTRAADLGDLTLSMLRGEEGNQVRELDELLAWLKTQPRPDVVSLSNALLLGLARGLRRELSVPVVCSLQGEDYFLDGLPAPHRAACWETLAQRAAEVEGFIAPSRYFADLMGQRLGLTPERVHVVYNGINLDGYPVPEADSNETTERMAAAAPVIGYFARMCAEKGLDLLVNAYIELRRRYPQLRPRLRIGGSCGPTDAALVEGLKKRLAAENLLGDVEFHPNLDRAAKVDFLRSLTVFCVPAPYGEAFGLYLVEAWAAGVPVVQPRVAAFPELVEHTGGGVLYDPGQPQALTTALAQLLQNPAPARQLGRQGQRAVFDRFHAPSMAKSTLAVMGSVLSMDRKK